MRRQRGLTIVELMVALAIGSLLALLAGMLLLTASDGLAEQSESVSLDDSGRFALESIGRAVRQAGYINFDTDGSAAELWSAASASVAGLDAHSLSQASAGIDNARPDVANGSDVLALRFAGAGAGPAGDGSVLNCAGFGVAASPREAERGWSIFYVGRADDGETELRCKYRGAHGWRADAIVRGVDAFQVLYGIDTDEAPDGVPNAYVSALTLQQLDDRLVVGGASAAERARNVNRKTYWKRVASIRVALLLHGERRVDTTAVAYDLFGPVYSAIHSMRDPGTRVDEQRMPDQLKKRRRQLFSATMALRNPQR